MQNLKSTLTLLLTLAALFTGSKGLSAAEVNITGNQVDGQLEVTDDAVLELQGTPPNAASALHIGVVEDSATDDLFTGGVSLEYLEDDTAGYPTLSWHGGQTMHYRWYRFSDDGIDNNNFLQMELSDADELILYSENSQSTPILRLQTDPPGLEMNSNMLDWSGGNLLLNDNLVLTDGAVGNFTTTGGMTLNADSNADGSQVFLDIQSDPGDGSGYFSTFNVNKQGDLTAAGTINAQDLNTGTILAADKELEISNDVRVYGQLNAEGVINANQGVNVNDRVVISSDGVLYAMRDDGSGNMVGFGDLSMGPFTDGGQNPGAADDADARNLYLKLNSDRLANGDAPITDAVKEVIYGVVLSLKGIENDWATTNSLALPNEPVWEHVHAMHVRIPGAYPSSTSDKERIWISPDVPLGGNQFVTRFNDAPEPGVRLTSNQYLGIQFNSTIQFGGGDDKHVSTIYSGVKTDTYPTGYPMLFSLSSVDKFNVGHDSWSYADWYPRFDSDAGTQIIYGANWQKGGGLIFDDAANTQISWTETASLTVAKHEARQVIMDGLYFNATNIQGAGRGMTPIPYALAAVKKVMSVQDARRLQEIFYKAGSSN